jgi:uncharacterized protein (DUF58 family)
LLWGGAWRSGKAHERLRISSPDPTSRRAVSTATLGIGEETLFDSAFLAKLEQLHLLSRKLARGERRAERRSRIHGSSLEFADYREYSAGDELRRIDWPAYARLERLFVKLYEQEQDLPVSFLVDASASMRWLPAQTAKYSKFNAARRLTAALAYIALANLDAVNIHFFDAQLLSELGVARGKAQFHDVLEFLRAAPAAGSSTRLLEGVKAFTQRVKRRGLVIVLSDFFDPAGYEEPLSLLRHAQFEVHALQFLHPAELEPEDLGDLRLMEAETGAALEVTVNETLLRRYREEFTTFNEGLDRFCLQRGIACARVMSDVPFEDTVLRVLRGGIILK